MNIINLHRRLSVTLLWLILAASVAAQTPVLFIDDVTATVDEEIEIKVRGTNVENAVGIQFSLTWDTLVLEYQGVKDIILEGALDENFNVSELDSGRLGYLEFDMNVQPMRIADSSLFFTVLFRAATTVSTETSVFFKEDPVSIAITDAANESIDPEMKAGIVNLEGANSLPTIVDDPRFTLAPNPFRDHSSISVDLAYGGAAWLEVIDIAGRNILRRPWALRPGLNNYTLSATELPAAGTYLVRLTTDREQLHRKLVLQGGGG